MGRAGPLCEGRAPLSPADRRRPSLPCCFPSPDGAPLLWLHGGLHAAAGLETAGPRLCPDGTAAAEPTPRTPKPSREVKLRAGPSPRPGGLVRAEVGSAARRGCQLSPQPARGRRIPMTTRTPHPPASGRAEPPAKPCCRRGWCPHSARVGSCRPAPMRGARSWGPRRPGGAPRASPLGGRPRAGGAAPPGLAASP